MFESPPLTLVQQILMVFGLVCPVLLVFICGIGITRVRQYREIIRCLKRELARAEGVDSWEDGPDTTFVDEDALPRDPHAAYPEASSAIEHAVAAEESEHARKMAALAPSHAIKVDVANKIVAFGQAWMVKNNVRGSFSVKEYLGGICVGSKVSVILRSEDGRCSSEVHISAPGKDYLENMNVVARTLLHARESEREYPTRKVG